MGIDMPSRMQRGSNLHELEQLPRMNKNQVDEFTKRAQELSK
jgi:hypothetical protein